MELKDGMESCLESANMTPLGLMVIVVGLLEASSVAVVIVDVSLEYCDSVVAREDAIEVSPEDGDDDDILLLVIDPDGLELMLLEEFMGVFVLARLEMLLIVDALCRLVLELGIIVGKTEGDKLGATLLEICEELNLLEVETLSVLLKPMLFEVGGFWIMLDNDELEVSMLVVTGADDVLGWVKLEGIEVAVELCFV